MISKTTLKKYVMGVQKQFELEDVFHKALKGLQNDNDSVSLICYEYQRAIGQVLEDQLGGVAYDYLMWWMWDCEFGTKRAKITVDNVDYDVSKFNDLYEICIKGAPNE